MKVRFPSHIDHTPHVPRISQEHLTQVQLDLMEDVFQSAHSPFTLKLSSFPLLPLK